MPYIIESAQRLFFKSLSSTIFKCCVHAWVFIVSAWEDVIHHMTHSPSSISSSFHRKRKEASFLLTSIYHHKCRTTAESFQWKHACTQWSQYIRFTGFLFGFSIYRQYVGRLHASFSSIDPTNDVSAVLCSCLVYRVMLCHSEVRSVNG